MYPDTPDARDASDSRDTLDLPARSASEALIEQFAQDYLKDRRSTRRWNLLIRLGWLIAFAVLVWGFVNQGSPASAPSIACFGSRARCLARPIRRRQIWWRSTGWVYGMRAIGLPRRPPRMLPTFPPPRRPSR